MFIALTLYIIISIVGNICISKVRKNDYRDWISWSLLLGPLSWPFQWHLDKTKVY